MDKSKQILIALIILIIVLIVGVVFGSIKYFTLQKNLEAAKAQLEYQKINENILGFVKLFIKEVLKAEKEVDFETRLKLETAIRNLNDKEVLAQWQKFVESKTETEAQDNVKDLLELLINKISVQ